MKQDFFEQLEQRCEAEDRPVSAGGRRDAWLVWMVAVGVVLAFVSPFIARSEIAFALLIGGLCLQLAGLAIFSCRQIRDVAPQFVDAKRKFALELDDAFVARQKILTWLRTVPENERLARLRYTEARLDYLNTRYSLVFGAVDKLGVLPVLIGFVVQAQASQSVSMPALILGPTIILLYGMSLWISRLRLQLEGYLRLMRAAG